MKYTPGPWLMNAFKAEVDALVDVDFVPVCKMLWPTDLRSEEETMANADLIAAAPEMYEALKKVADSWEYMEPEVEEAVKAALVKAEGR